MKRIFSILVKTFLFMAGVVIIGASYVDQIQELRRSWRTLLSI